MLPTTNPKNFICGKILVGRDIFCINNTTYDPMEPSRIRLNSTEKRKRRQRAGRFQVEQEIMKDQKPPKKVMAWSGGKVKHNKDTALLAYLQRLQREGKSLSKPQSEALERILTSKFPDQDLDQLLESNQNKKQDVQFKWNADSDSDSDESTNNKTQSIKLASRPDRLGLGATHIVHKAAPESEEALAKKISKSEKRRLRREQEEKEMDEEERRRKNGENDASTDSRAGLLTSRSKHKQSETIREKEIEEEKKRVKKEKNKRKKERKKQKKEEEKKKALETNKEASEDGVVISRKVEKSFNTDSKPKTKKQQAAEMKQMLKDQLEQHDSNAKHGKGDQDIIKNQSSHSNSNSSESVSNTKDTSIDGQKKVNTEIAPSGGLGGDYPRGVCHQFQRGECNRGDYCKFSHEKSLPTKKKSGYQKRKKTRSRQKNIKKDTRIAAAKPTFLTPGSSDYNPHAARINRRNIDISVDREGTGESPSKKRRVVDDTKNDDSIKKKIKKEKIKIKKKKKKKKNNGTIIVGPPTLKSRVEGPDVKEEEWKKSSTQKDVLKNDDYFNSNGMSNWD
jgi:hypothetical protein